MDPKYKELLLIKKINKALDEITSNEDLIHKIFEWRDTQDPDIEPDKISQSEDEIDREIREEAEAEMK